MRQQRGFTVPEIIIAVLLVAILALFAFSQEQNARAAQRDDARKTSINAMYFYLEEVYFPAHQSYPTVLLSENTKGIDPELLKDPSGYIVGNKASNFRYEPADCNAGACKRYTLRANLEKEADFIRESRNK
ncbi:MAG TPA: type II secretion system protein [Candidatus Saccharimonadales bacterium]